MMKRKHEKYFLSFSLLSSPSSGFSESVKTLIFEGGGFFAERKRGMKKKCWREREKNESEKERKKKESEKERERERWKVCWLGREMNYKSLPWLSWWYCYYFIPPLFTDYCYCNSSEREREREKERKREKAKKWRKKEKKRREKREWCRQWTSQKSFATVSKPYIHCSLSPLSLLSLSLSLFPLFLPSFSPSLFQLFQPAS